MIEVSFLTSLYRPLPSDPLNHPCESLKTLFFNHAELTWSVSMTHGLKLKSQAEPIFWSKYSITQLFNWTTLGLLLAIQTKLTLFALGVLLTGKLYHYSTVINSPSTSIPLKKTEPPIHSSLPPEIEPSLPELFDFLFKNLLTKETLPTIATLGSRLDEINKFLDTFNTKYSSQLKAIGSFHSNIPNDPWQTIKIIDLGVKEEGKESPFLTKLHHMLTNEFGILSNGGNSGVQSISKDTPKKVPCSFRQTSGTFMYPQLQISRIDIEKVLGSFKTTEEYVAQLKKAYGS